MEEHDTMESMNNEKEVTKKVDVGNLIKDTKNVMKNPKDIKKYPQVLVLVGGLLFVILAIVVVCVLLFNRKTTIDLNDYVKFEVNGYNGYGVANASVDRDKLAEAIILKESDLIDEDEAYIKEMLNNTSEQGQNGINKKAVRKIIESALSYQISKKDKLSNGDSVELIWDENMQDKLDVMEDTFEVNFSYDDMEIEAENLKEPKEIDPLGKIKVATSGLNGEASAFCDEESFEENITGPLREELSCVIEPSENLSNGDKVSLKLEVNEGTEDSLENLFGRFGYKLKRSSMEYTISGVASLIEDANMIPEAELEKIKQGSLNAIKEELDEDEKEHICREKFAGVYVLNSNENETSEDGVEESQDRNIIYAIWEIEFEKKRYFADSLRRSRNITGYFWSKYTDVSLEADSTINRDFAHAETNRSSNPVYSFDDYWKVKVGKEKKVVEFQTFWPLRAYESLEVLEKNEITPQNQSYTVTSKLF